LWTLEGLGALEAADLTRALRDEHGAVRENALRIAEARLATSADLLPDVLRLAGDPDDRVRLHAALALGGTGDPRAVEALASIARRDGAQRWTRAAVLGSIRGRSNEFLRAFVASPASSQAVRAAVMQDLGRIFGAGESRERCLDLILEITERSTEVGWQAAALAGIADGLQARGLREKDRSALMTLLHVESPRARTAMARVGTVLSRAHRLALDEKTPVDLRLAAIGLMAHAESASVGNALADLLAPQHPPEIQVAAVRALSRLPGPAAAAMLVEPPRWAAFTPRVREAVLSALIGEERLTGVLLDALDAQAISPAALGPSRRNRLTTHRNPAIRARARALLSSSDPADRMQVYERLRSSVLDRTGNAASGGQVFAAHCAACHAFGGVGGRLGPDLSGIRNQPAEAILLHALVPDYEITPGYQAYLVETRDGRTLFGRLESETPASVTLRDASSQSHAILRTQIVSMSASTRSLMPNELERAIPEQGLADLVAYLKSGGEVRERTKTK
jgi:putative heme-binding domain-containing protein